ncbi:MAG: hypothetical protein NZ552_00310 [Planctomycetes bacterium]|nr:hypothetical protein [Planctomycetota bacterium]
MPSFENNNPLKLQTPHSQFQHSDNSFGSHSRHSDNSFDSAFQDDDDDSSYFYKLSKFIGDHVPDIFSRVFLLGFIWQCCITILYICIYLFIIFVCFFIIVFASLAELSRLSSQTLRSRPRKYASYESVFSKIHLPDNTRQ